jgi:hypothetical protein
MNGKEGGSGVLRKCNAVDGLWYLSCVAVHLMYGAHLRSRVALFGVRAMVALRTGQQATGVILPRTSSHVANRLEAVEPLSRTPGQSCASLIAFRARLKSLAS